MSTMVEQLQGVNATDPIAEAELAEAEKALGAPLPATYREVVAELGAFTYGSRGRVLAPKELVAVTQAIRKTFGTEKKYQKVLDRLVFVECQGEPSDFKSSDVGDGALGVDTETGETRFLEYDSPGKVLKARTVSLQAHWRNIALDGDACNDLDVALRNPKKISSLSLRQQGDISPRIAELVNLESFSICYSEFTEVPVELAKLERLRMLDLSFNYAFAKLPDEVLAIPSLREISFYDAPLPKTYNQAQVNALLGGFAKMNPPPERTERLVHIGLLLKHDDSVRKHGTHEYLLRALDSNVAAVRTAALKALASGLIGAGAPREGAPAIAPIDGSSEVAVLGKTLTDFDALSARVAKAGGRVVKTVGPKTTHVIVGEQPKEKWRAALTRKLPVFAESALTQSLDGNVGKPHLVARAEGHERLGELLASADDANAQLAIAMMKNGGAPAGVSEELLILFQNPARDAKLRAAAKKLFLAHAPEEAKSAVEKVLLRVSLFAAGETKVTERLRALHEASKGALDGVKLATLLLPHRRGFTYLFESNDRDVVRRALESRCEGDTLNLAGGELSELPDAARDLKGIRAVKLGIEGLSHNHFRRVPGVLADMTSIESVDLTENRLSSIDETLSKLPKLTELDVSGNFFRTFPVGVCALKALRKLNLSTVRYGADREIPLDSIPEDIGQLRELEELSFHAHHLKLFPEALRTLPKLRSLDLRSCKLEVVPAWLSALPALKEIGLGCVESADKKGLTRLIEELRERGVQVSLR